VSINKAGVVLLIIGVFVFMRSIAIWIIAFCVCFIWAFGVEAAPQIEFVKGITFDSGKVEINNKLTHTFVFKNTGDSTLKIERLESG
jgi:hypothetical protein